MKRYARSEAPPNGGLHEQLQEEAETFRLLMDAAPVMVWMSGLDKRCTYFNKPWLDFTGRTMEQELGDGWIDGVHPADRDRCLAVYERAFDSRENFSMDYRLLRADGIYRWILDHGVPVSTSDGRFAGYIGSCVDITDRKEIEESLRSSEERYRAFFELNVVGAAEVGLGDGRYVRANDAYCRMLGYTQNELLRLRFVDITYPDDRTDDVRQFIRLVRGEIPDYKLEKRYLRKDGGIMWAQLAVTLIRDSAGNPISELGLVVDITERRRAEQDLQRLAARLLQTQEEERRRIARELHDQTAQSLLAIKWNLDDLLRSRRALDDEARDVLTESLEMTQQLVEEVRTASYLLHPPLLDEAGLQSALSWYVDGFVKRSGIDVELVVAPDMGRSTPEIETALFRIVQESLTNIHRHSGSARASIVLTADENRVALEVRDEGHGLVTEDGAFDEEILALGVGISGMRERIRQLSGELTIRSGSTGTTVIAIVPQSRSEP